ncbi:M20 metallopeptidase family protein [Roseibium algae]|uniref:M20 family metallopeptidase n=1 Tax=Roseibium algae TaxID=3123038 RepID=A0ABU8THZ4_9HYPH
MHGANDIGPVIDDLVSANEPRLIAIRRDIHTHPEIGFETIRTAGIVVDELRALGLDPQTGVGRTGVVAEIDGDAPGPCLILRADMDALPIHEQTGLPFSSSVPGKMHACGHDVHTASLLGAAAALVKLAPRMRGRVRLVFQPAEETQESGARAMIEDGAADGADMAIAFHNMPQLPAGQLQLVRGASTASSDEFKVTLHGLSGHAASPHLANDPIVGAASLIMQLQTIVSRSMDPTDPIVLTIGHIQGGHTQNIIPDSCAFEGTVRCRSAAARDMAEDTMRRMCEQGAASMGLEAEVDYARGVPALQNDDRIVDTALQALTQQFGKEPSIEKDINFGAEDFSLFSERLPSIQLHVGSGQPGRDDRLHNSDYQPDEISIGQSARALTGLALALLS